LDFQNDNSNPPDLREFLPRNKTFRERRQVSLANLLGGQHVDIIAKVVSAKIRTGKEARSSTKILTGVLEDSTFKVPFISRKISLVLKKNRVLAVHSAYVHEFDDRALLLILTKDAEIEVKYREDPQKYVWYAKIGCIHRPVWNVKLKGTVAKIHDTSGLVKRCNRCNAIFYDRCMSGCEDGWKWDFRVATTLHDNTGSIKMIVGRDLLSSFLNRDLSNTVAKVQHFQLPEKSEVYPFKTVVPELDIVEAVVDDLHQYTQSGRITVSDGKTRIYCLPPIEITDYIKKSRRQLIPQNSEDALLVQRLIRKALHVRISQITKKPFIHGIHLLEKPISLNRCERAQLYLGFSTTIAIASSDLTVKASPQAYIRESVLEYIHWALKHGENARAIQRSILRGGRSVVLAPFGHFGQIEGIINVKAGDTHVSEFDKRSYVELWKEMYNVNVDPTETPLIKVRLKKSSLPLVYPPSCVYFDRSTLFLTANTRQHIEQKRLALKQKIQAIMERVFQCTTLGNVELKCVNDGVQHVSVQQLLLCEFRQKLLGHLVQTTGNIVQLKSRFYFLPHNIRKIE
jgi:hypothetical protein